MAEIPLRPKGFDKRGLRKADADCLTYLALFGCRNEEAFARFHPEFLDEAGKLNDSGRQASRQFFIYAKNKQYLDDYRATLEEFCGRRGRRGEAGTDIDDSRKERALKSLLNQAMSMVEGGADLDADTLKTVTEIFKKLNILKEDVERQEAPRRYLPQLCSQCLYRSFVESHVGTGEIENACLRCKALAAAQAHGFRYDPKNLLRPDGGEAGRPETP